MTTKKDTPPQPGWIGNLSEVLSFLAVVGAEKDSEGQFALYGAPPVFGMDPREVVIPAETTYEIEGRMTPLAANMPASYGLKVHVIA